MKGQRSKGAKGNNLVPLPLCSFIPLPNGNSEGYRRIFRPAVILLTLARASA